jgi:hypothetical protein
MALQKNASNNRYYNLPTFKPRFAPLIEPRGPPTLSNYESMTKQRKALVEAALKPSNRSL